MTLNTAILEVLRTNMGWMTANEIWQEIEQRGLYPQGEDNVNPQAQVFNRLRQEEADGTVEIDMSNGKPYLSRIRR